jgi:RNA polymerase sigma-70 factor (ECF subfamily)
MPCHPLLPLAVLERYHRELLGFLSRKVTDAATAGDLVQESYARVYAAQQAGLVISDPRALLYRTARNLLVDHHRRSRVRDEGDAATGQDPEDVDVDEVIAGPQYEPEARVAARQELAVLAACIDALPPRCRETFELYKFEELSYAEVAQRMGVSVRTVEMQLRLAMQACREALSNSQRARDRLRTPPT